MQTRRGGLKRKSEYVVQEKYLYNSAENHLQNIINFRNVFKLFSFQDIILLKKLNINSMKYDNSIVKHILSHFFLYWISFNSFDHFIKQNESFWKPCLLLGCKKFYFKAFSSSPNYGTSLVDFPSRVATSILKSIFRLSDCIHEYLIENICWLNSVGAAKHLKLLLILIVSSSAVVSVRVKATFMKTFT